MSEKSLYPKLIKSAQDLAIFNAYNQNYDLTIKHNFYPKEREAILEKYKLDTEEDSIKTKVLQDYEHLKAIQANRNRLFRPAVGDYITEEGILKRLCRSHREHRFQVGPLVGSYHISSQGNSSYSGGCNESVDLTSYIPMAASYQK